MKKTFAIIIILLCFKNISGQELLELYKDYLPDTVWVNLVLKNNVERSLEELSSIHPNLIYNLLSYLNINYQYNFNAADRAISLEHYFNARRFYYTQRADWVKGQYNKINNSNIIALKKNNAEKLFMDYSNKLNPIYELEKTNGENLKAYYSYKYYTKDTSLVYLESNNYSLLVSKYLKSKIEYFKEALHDFESLPRDREIDLVLEMKKYWFVFTELDDNLEKSNIEPYLYAILIYENDYQNNDRFIITSSFSVGSSNLLQYDESYQYSDYISSQYTQPMTYDFPIKIQSASNFNIGVGYKFAIKNELQFLSHITIKAIYSFTTQTVEVENLGSAFFTFGIRNVNNREREILEYNVSEIEDMNKHIGFFEISFPAFYFTKDLFIDVGGMIGADYLSYALSFKRIEKRVEGWGENMLVNEIYKTENRGKYEYSNIYFRLSPMIAIVYSLSDMFDLRTEIHGNVSGNYGRISLDLKI